MIRKCLFFIIIFFISIVSAQAATYYVKNGGNDALSGADDANAWATIAKVMTSAGSGDTIYFKRGSIWREQLTIPASGITLDAYGTGDKPIISGADVISGSWSVHSGNIYKISLDATVYQIFDDGAWAILAHEPDGNGNTTWFLADSSQNSCYLIGESGNDMTYSEAQIIGASVATREQQWFRNLYKIQSYSTVTDLITLVNDGRSGSSSTGHTWHDYSGAFKRVEYWLADKLLFLDSENEWFYDEDANMLYVYQTGGGSPAGTWEYTTRRYGIYADTKDNLTIQNIQIEKAIMGVELRDCLNFDVNNNDILDIGTQRYIIFDSGYDVENGNTSIGLRIYGPDDRESALNHVSYNGEVYENNFTDIYENGIRVSDYHSIYIHDNTITNTATIGESVGWGSHSGSSYAITAGAAWSGDDSKVSYNELTNVGSFGISFGRNAIISHNTITNAVAYFGDSGSIYSGFDDQGLIEYNIIDMTDGKDNYGNTKTGIYLDGSMQDTVLDHNNITGAGICMFAHGGTNNTFTNNTCIDYYYWGGILITAWRNWFEDDNLIESVVITGNTLRTQYSLETANYPYHIALANWFVTNQNPIEDWFDDPSDFDNNKYYPDGTYAFYNYEPVGYSHYYNFTGWQAATGFDVNSIISGIETSGTVLSYYGGNISEVQVVEGGKTIDYTIAGDTWVPTLGEDNAITDAFIAGITCTSDVQPAGFAAQVAPTITYDDFTRVSDTVFRLTLNAVPGYDIDSNETWQTIIPDSATTGTNEPITAYPDITISMVADEPATVTGLRITYDPAGPKMVYEEAPEVFTFTKNADADVTVVFTLKITNGEVVEIQWGDGDRTVCTGTGANVAYTHTYADAAEYSITFYADIENLLGFWEGDYE